MELQDIWNCIQTAKWEIIYETGMLRGLDYRILIGLLGSTIIIVALQITCLWKLYKLGKRLKEKDESPHPSE